MARSGGGGRLRRREGRVGFACLLLQAACGGVPGVPIDPAEESARLGSDLVDCRATESATGALQVTEKATGLEVPWGLARAPDGRLFVTERPGRVRLLTPDGLDPEPWAELEVHHSSEGGLLGIALSPDFTEDGTIFVALTRLRTGPSRASRWMGGLQRRVESVLGIREGGTAVELQVVRLRESGGRGVQDGVVVRGIPASGLHSGGALQVGPDGMLYLSVGDGAIPPLAADVRDRRGTILRYRPDGGVPEDNPLPGSPVWAWGFRNVQGLAWDPGSGELFAVDHGPTGLPDEGFRTDRDELNRVMPGADHGWPSVSGRVAREGAVVPEVEWTPALAPAGLAFVDAPGTPWHGNALVGGLRQELRRVVFSPESGAPVCQEVLLRGEVGRIRSVLPWEDGGVLVTTSNRDERGVPFPGDDRILHVRPMP